MRKKILLAVGGTTGLLLIVGVGYFGFTRFNQPLISPEVSSKLTSALYVATSNDVKIQKETVKYDENLKQLSYVSSFKDTKIIVSEQPSPEIFSDVPQYFDKWIASTGAIANFDTPNGKVYLASNPKYGVNTVAIMNTNGTLLFAKPDKSLDQDQWKQFFRSLKLQS